MKTLFITIFLHVCLIVSVFGQNSTAITIVPPDTGNHFELGVGEAEIKISSEITNGVFSQMVLTEYPRYETPLHIHDHTTEVFYVVEGTLTLLVDGVHKFVEAGSFVFVPKGTPHAQGNFTNSNLRLIISFYPAGFEKFFEARSEIIKLHPPGTKQYGIQMRKLGQKYDIRNIDYDPFRE